MKKTDDDIPQSMQHHVDWFRSSAPYIHAHRGNTFVILFGGEAVEDDGFANLIHDIALLSSLGVKLVLVHGARPQIDAELDAEGVTTEIACGLRVTTPEAMPCVEKAVGRVRMRIESQLSMGLPNTPMSGSAIKVVSGNFITAQPWGVREGIDYHQTGNVRRVDADAISNQLASNNIVMLSPVGYSTTGETFNLRAEDVATEVAIAIGADKLVFAMENSGVLNSELEPLPQLSLQEAEHWYSEHGEGLADADDIRLHLNNAARACRKGVKRAHLISRKTDGALLLELYTRDGIGTLVSADNYEGLRHATIEDIGGIMELIIPLEESGVLVKRSREQLELDIGNFTVIERDGMIIACAALFAFDTGQSGELACLAVHADYQQHGRGDDLLQHIEWQARKQHIEHLFILTTQTMHWFVEHGFTETSLSRLPVDKQELYNYQRRSKILHKEL